MNNLEFSAQFDVLYNNVTSNQAPGLNEAEKSVFLTKAEKQLVIETFNPRVDGVGGGFDGSQKRQYDFSKIIKTAKLAEITSSVSEDNILDRRSKVYVFPDDYFLAVNEIIADNKYQYSVLPIDYAEYSRLMLKPYNFPVKRGVWRIFTGKFKPSVAYSAVCLRAFPFEFIPTKLNMWVGPTQWQAFETTPVSSIPNDTNYGTFKLGDFYEDSVGKYRIAIAVKEEVGEKNSICVCLDTTYLNTTRYLTDDTQTHVANDSDAYYFVKKYLEAKHGTLDKEFEDLYLLIESGLYNPAINDTDTSSILGMSEEGYLAVREEDEVPYYATPITAPVDKTTKYWILTSISDTSGRKDNIGGESKACVIAEVIGKFVGALTYKLRYVKTLKPIILDDLTNYGADFTIDGLSAPTECELPEETHQEILERAVTLAKIAWAGGTATQAAAQQQRGNQQ